MVGVVEVVVEEYGKLNNLWDARKKVLKGGEYCYNCCEKGVRRACVCVWIGIMCRVEISHVALRSSLPC